MTINGYAGITLKGRRIIRDPLRGIFTEQLWQGPIDAIEAAFTTVPTTLYCECDTMNPPVGTLLLRTPDFGDGGADEVQTTYDLVSGASQKHIFEHPKAQALGSTVLASIWDGFEDNTAVSGLNANGTTLLEMLKLRQDSFFCSQPVFKYSRFVNQNSNIVVSSSSVGRVYTSAAMINETAAPAWWQTAINSAYTAMVSFYGSTPSGHTIGWLKSFPQYSGAPGGKMVVTIEYMLEAWRNFSYTA